MNYEDVITGRLGSHAGNGTGLRNSATSLSEYRYWLITGA
jgi:hypothetical protein